MGLLIHSIKVASQNTYTRFKGIINFVGWAIIVACWLLSSGYFGMLIHEYFAFLQFDDSMLNWLSLFVSFVIVAVIEMIVANFLVEFFKEFLFFTKGRK